MAGDGCILCCKTQHTKTSLHLLWLSLGVNMGPFCDRAHNYYKEKPPMDWDLWRFSARRQDSDQPSNGGNIRLWEQKAAGHPNATDNQRVLDTFMGGSSPVSDSVLPVTLFSFKSAAHLFSSLSPPPFLPFLSSLALEHWCKNFKQHQPWCNSSWFTGSWRLFFACRHAEWQMLWRSCSCPDKSQVKTKVVETFRHKSKSGGRKNLERSPWIWTVGVPGTFAVIWITALWSWENSATWGWWE